MKGLATLMSSASDEWATPWDFFDSLNYEFGFTVDAAATKENAKCSKYIALEESHHADPDALTVNWGLHETVWLNPPYSRIRDFMSKAAEESVRNTVVALVPARTCTRWWHDACRQAHEVRLIKGRLKFGGAGSAPFPSALIVFRPDPDKGFHETHIYNWDWRKA
jgi:phage N-6-adenine-methyltransferase